MSGSFSWQDPPESEALQGVQPKAIEGSLLNNNGADKTYMQLALEDDIPGKLVVGLSRSGDVTLVLKLLTRYAEESIYVGSDVNNDHMTKYLK